MDKNKLIQTVSAAQNGNKEAFVTLYEEYHRLALQTALKLSSDVNDAWDIVQETFIEVERSIGKLNHPESFTSWLISIVISKTKLMFRKNKNINMDDGQIDNAVNEICDFRKENLPRTNIRHKSDMDVLNNCISKLSPEHQMVIYLKYFKQMSLQEIASELDIPLGTVKSRLNLAKSRLKKDIELYQKTNDTDITFNTSALTALAAGASISNQGIEAASSFRGVVTFIRKPLTKIVLCSSALGLTAFSFLLIQANEPDAEPRQKIIANESFTSDNLRKFHAIEFEHKIIHNPKEAYEALIRWAHCSIELNQASKDSLKHALPLYQELKNYGGGYFEMLQSAGWAEEFEKLCTVI